jgi:Holliday junction DNA helicase RuvA
MIHHINGKLVEKSPTYAVIEAAGVGYFINISLNTYSQLGSSESCKLFTHLSIKEDSHTLYGFFDTTEREVFRKLISVNGVGAGTARMMLSSLNPSEIAVAISSGNVTVLKGVKGIGLKTAERIIIDLKDKMGKESSVDYSDFSRPQNNNQNEALFALVALGFVKNQVEKVLQKINGQTENLSVEAMIKEALKLL